MRQASVAVMGIMTLITLSCAQTTPAPQPPVGRQQAAQPAGIYRIAGRVVNSATGGPVIHAAVTALSEENRGVVQSTMSDNEGRFVLEGMPAGKYPLTATKRGFRTAFYDEHDEYNSAIVTGEGQDTTHLVFQLAPGAVLRGTVTGDGGDAVETASVLLFKKQPDGTHNRQVDATTTDDTGSYEFSNLSPGDYFVAVTATPWYATPQQAGRAQNAGTDLNPSLDVAYPATFFDSTTDEASATPITLAAGAHERADINLHAVPALHLRVPVLRRQDGRGIARPELRQMIFGTQVSAESGGTLDSLRSGSMVFDGVAPGRYELSAGDPPRVVELNASASEDIDMTAGTPVLRVSGTMRTAAGTAPAENLVAILEPSDNDRGANPMQTVVQKGGFHFDSVPPGTYDLSLAGANPALTVVSITAGGVQSPGGRITVKDHSLAINAEVAAAGGNIQGFAQKAGKAFAGAMIVLVSKRQSAYHALVRRDQSDSDGSFSLRDVAAGQYTVIAIEDGWKLDWQRWDTITPYLSAGIDVTVPERSGGPIRLTRTVQVQPRR